MGIRVIKTAIAALAALYTAHYLGLQPPLAAGLLAIIGVEVTVLRGLRNAFARFMASVLGLFFASLLFILLGFHLWTISIFILFAFPILSRFHLKEGIVTSAVIVFHVYAKEEVTTHLIGNEIMLLLTGLGWALIVNLLYIPKEEHKLVELRHMTEEKFGAIFTKMAQTLRNPALVWDGEELLDAGKAIEEGIRRADVSRENLIWRELRGSFGVKMHWSNYFEMRQQQLDSISLMLTQLAHVYESLPQGELAAELFEDLAGDLKSDVYEGKVEENRKLLGERFRSMALPTTREEFEIRAAIWHLMHELEHYLAIARRLKKQKNSLDTAAAAD
ncbi:uncharacterized membrane protein YgaE (UPF0421/DUF939 family) [Paenibacillus taihuensis]|uniref:Uncharacterized membrane protein YgaE (UPF0421/DUF939 family) n=1 Tax=Paenibacillus taihuensis TaxID=1156355 RepID=A0A3D9Q3H1_9BACL|nr:aromatic acid exporter family protein [Paenibacillus taihuensis]REE57379.1 uncharacterized membrane protein YgaE (UPF0421/DUF939 family) [Paenibacillus taihuensis]